MKYIYSKCLLTKENCRNSMKKHIQNATLVICSVLVFLIILELSVRVFEFWKIPNYEAANWFRPSGNSRVPYLLKPNVHQRWGQGDVITNSEGIRSNRSFPEQHSGVTRILALGDSVTFGFGVDQADTFPAHLESLINRSNRQNHLVEVINAGINGFSLADEANYLREIIDLYKPDAIVWTLVPNDYDDSLGVTKEGTLSWESNDYVLNSSHEFALGQDPKKQADFNDFRKSMNPAALNWATGIVQKPSLFEEFLKKSYLYNWITWLAKDVLKTDPIQVSMPDHARQEYWHASKGKREPFPPHIALYSYSSRIDAFNEKLADTKRFTASKGIPLVIVNTALPVHATNMINEPLYYYFDSSVLMNEPFYQFHKNNNLRWDAHFSPNGNKLFALGVLKGLVCSKVIDGAEDCDEIKKLQDEHLDYWKTFAASQEAYTAQFLPFIDFINYKGFPQIAGGIFPPGDFPAAPSQRAELVLARPAQGDKTFHLEFAHNLSTALRMHLTLTLGKKVIHKEVVIESGNRDAELDLSGLFNNNPSSKLIEVSLVCSERNCTPSKLAYIGFGASKRKSSEDGLSPQTSPVLELKVSDWGPKSTKKRVNPNIQPDGGMGIWIQLADTKGLGDAQVIFGGEPANTTSVQEKLVTASIKNEQLSSVGNKQLIIKQTLTGRTYLVGTFVVESD